MSRKWLRITNVKTASPWDRYAGKNLLSTCCVCLSHVTDSHSHPGWILFLLVWISGSSLPEVMSHTIAHTFCENSVFQDQTTTVLFFRHHCVVLKFSRPDNDCPGGRCLVLKFQDQWMTKQCGRCLVLVIVWSCYTGKPSELIRVPGASLNAWKCGKPFLTFSTVL